MIDDIDIFLTGEEINTGPENPLTFKIVRVEKREFQDRKTQETISRWVAVCNVDEEERSIMLNKTSLRNLILAFGRDESKWPGKEILVWTIQKDVFGEAKKVIYAKPKQEVSNRG